MDDSSSFGHGTASGAAERREPMTAEDNPRSPRELTPQIRIGATESGTAAAKRSPNRVHFTPDLPEDAAPLPPQQQQQDGTLEQPIPPRRPPPQPAGNTSFTPNSFTPASPSPAPMRTATQHYNAPTHGGPADIAKSRDTELLEQAMTGATWEQPANIRLSVLADFEPCCSVELRVYQGQFITGLFQNGAWVYVRASNGAEGYLPSVSCALTSGRPPSIDISSSGVSSVGTADDDAASNSGGRSSHTSSLDRVVTAIERGSASSSGVGMTSPDGRTSGYSSEPEKMSPQRVKFAPTASILQPGYRNVHIPEEYVAMYPGQRPRAGSSSMAKTTTATATSPMAAWQASRAGGHQRPPAQSSGHGGQARTQPPLGYHYGTVPGGSATAHGISAITRNRNMSYPMDRQYGGGGGGGGNSPLAMSAADQRALSESSNHSGQSAQAASSSSSRSRRLIDRLRNFRSSAAPASMDVFDADGSNVSQAMPSTGGSIPSAKESKKEIKRRKQQKKSSSSSSSRHKEYVMSDTELTTNRVMAPLASCRAAPMTDSELSTRQLQRLDLAGLPITRQHAAGHRASHRGSGHHMANAGTHQPYHPHNHQQQHHRQQQPQQQPPPPQQQQQQRYPFTSSHNIAANPLLSNPGSRKSVATSQPSRLAGDNEVMMVTSFVLYDFEAQQDGQLSVKRGQPVWKIYTANDVIKGGEVGWIFVMDPESKQKGFIPQACLQPLPNPSSLAMSRALGVQKQFPAS